MEPLYGIGLVVVILGLAFVADGLSWLDQWLAKKKATSSKRRP